MKRIKLGQITAPVGIRGELRVYPYVDITRFSAIENIVLGDEKSPRALKKIRRDKNLAVISVEGIEDRNAAELCRNMLVWLPEDASWDMEDDTYFIEDLEGISVQDEKSTVLGTVCGVIRNPGHDVYEIRKPDDKVFLMPAVKEFVLDVDLEQRRMTVRLIEGLIDL